MSIYYFLANIVIFLILYFIIYYDNSSSDFFMTMSDCLLGSYNQELSCIFLETTNHTFFSIAAKRKQYNEIYDFQVVFA